MSTDFFLLLKALGESWEYIHVLYSVSVLLPLCAANYLEIRNSIQY